MNDDELFEVAMTEARKALAEKEVPIGCVFYHRGFNKIVARGRNSVNATKNATRHAELNCVDEVVANFRDQKYENSDNFWLEIDVYVTCEPCIMCARLLRHLKVNKVFYGCSNDRFGGCRSVINVASLARIPEKSLEFVHSIREKDAIDILKVFYSGENQNAPEEIRKVKKNRVR